VRGSRGLHLEDDVECEVQEAFISRMVWSARFKRPSSREWCGVRGSRGRLKSGVLIGVDDDPAAETRKPGIEHWFRDWEIGGIGRWEIGGQTSNDSTAYGCS
jgi:hypothetical protein